MFCQITMVLPEKLIRKLSEKGIDIETYLIEVLTREFCDPIDEIEIRLELAEKYLGEAKDYLEKGDPVQASEKLYKVAEECIKALAIKFNIPELYEARKEGRWWTKLLSKAAKTLSIRLNEPTINRGWSIAYDLHVWGFHEAVLTIDHIKASVKDIEYLFEKTRELLKM